MPQQKARIFTSIHWPTNIPQALDILSRTPYCSAASWRNEENEEDRKTNQEDQLNSPLPSPSIRQLCSHGHPAQAPSIPPSCLQAGPCKSLIRHRPWCFQLRWWMQRSGRLGRRWCIDFEDRRKRERVPICWRPLLRRRRKKGKWEVWIDLGLYRTYRGQWVKAHSKTKKTRESRTRNSRIRNPDSHPFFHFPTYMRNPMQ